MIPIRTALRGSRSFLRIFLHYWLTTLSLLLISVLATQWYESQIRKQLAGNHTPQVSETTSTKLMRDSTSILVNLNLPGLKKLVEITPDWLPDRLFLIDQYGQAILPNRPPDPVLRINSTLNDKHMLAEGNIDDGTPFLARRMYLQDGEPLHVVIFPAGNSMLLAVQMAIDKIQPVVLITCLILSAIICFRIAREITSDIQHIQMATQRIAQGNMDVDVSSRFRHRRDEMYELSKDIEKMAATLQRAMQEQKRLIKDVSHELRSPLTRLQIALGIAQQRAPGMIDNELNYIREAANYLNELISDILSLPTTEDEHWELSDAVDLRGLLHVLYSYGHPDATATAKQVDVQFQSQVDEALVMTKGNTLMSAFSNVLRNAIHYTAPSTRVLMTLDITSANFYKITVRDHGPGVNDDILEDIFLPFYRSDEARARSSGGFGLGLSIAQRTIQLHGGTVKAENHPEGGLLITILLPAA